MASRPVLRKLIRDIEEVGGDDHIFARVADGESVRQLMEPFGVSRQMFYDWLRRDGKDHPATKEREARYAEAKELSGEAHLENGLQILDEMADRPAPTSGEVQVAVNRANYRKWLAGVRDRSLADRAQAGAGTVINIGTLHLDALRQAGHMPGARGELPGPDEPEAIEAEFEIEGEVAEATEPEAEPTEDPLAELLEV